MFSSLVTRLLQYRFTPYHIGVSLSSLSVLLGLLREFLIINLLGLSHSNDELQLYLSVFYTIGLVFDPMRLACLNLCQHASLARLLLCASIAALPYAVTIGFLLALLASHTEPQLIITATIGGYLNVIMAMMVTYKQRFGRYLPAVFINVLPNLILIPGILIISHLPRYDFIKTLVDLFLVLPIIQLALLFLLQDKRTEQTTQSNSLWQDLSVFLRHGVAIIGEQLFQVFSRAILLGVGAGFLSLYSLAIRLYTTTRYIVIDNYIGVKLQNWTEKHSSKASLSNNTNVMMALIVASFAISCVPSSGLFSFAIYLVFLLLVSFVFSSMLRILYFKINNKDYNQALIKRYALFEIATAALLYLLATLLHLPILLLIWGWYILRPYIQMQLLTSYSPIVT